MREKWEDVEGFPDHLVSNYGQVYNMKTQNILAISVNQTGVPHVGLVIEGKQYKRSVAILVASVFIEKPAEHYDTPMHLDGVRTNCNINNLVWRPRWFVRKYHEQFKDRVFHDMVGPFEIVETGETFNKMKEVCVKYGLLWNDVLNSAYSHAPHKKKPFPTQYSFRFIVR